MFKKVYIEISNICNLQCTFCPEVKRDKKIMSPALFQSILKQVVPITEQVCLHLMGEPLAHPEFVQIMKICEEEKAKINLTSNAILLNKHRELLLSHPTLQQVNFSLHSFRDNFPGKSMDEYLNDVFTFSQEMSDRKPETYINYRLWNQEHTHELNFTNQEILQGIESFFKVEVNSNLALNWKKSKKIINRLYLHFDTEFEWPSLQNKFRTTKGFCHALSTHIGIHADGTVVPCCLDKEAGVNLGKCSEKSLEEILNSKRVQEMRQGFKNQKLLEDLCQRCTYIERFDRKKITGLKSEEITL
ncbi:MAG: radical SAM/SPASM domain-containing protein [Bacteriovoracaceae bacterium]